jgi:hypothetical protein
LSQAAAGALTSQLRAAPSPQRLAQLMECNSSHLAGPHVAAAFNELANMTHAHPRIMEPLLRQHLLPALDSLIQETEAAEDLPSATA